MKTAISIPDDLFEAAEGLAKELGVSRSELFQRAVAAYVARHVDDRRRFIELVDEVCERVDLMPDPLLYAAQFEALSGNDDEW